LLRRREWIEKLVTVVDWYCYGGKGKRKEREKVVRGGDVAEDKWGKWKNE
jgi:hypothetical protein